MLELLGHIAVDAQAPVDLDNPLNQVLINTHSPVVVGLVPKDSIVFAKRGRSGLMFLPMDGTWRKAERGSIALGEVLAFLNPLGKDRLGYTTSATSVRRSLLLNGQLELDV